MQSCIKAYKNGVYVGEEDCAQVSEEQLIEEQEQEALRKADELIDAIKDLAGAKAFLKRLVKRLLKNGALP